jgi:hypothetical protein
MPAPTQFTFSYKEVVELLVRKAEITEGIWGLQVRFGMQATNINQADGTLLPAAVVGILEIGLQKFDKLNNIAIDAGELAKQDTGKSAARPDGSSHKGKVKH